MKFDMEEGTECPSSMPAFTPIRCNVKGMGPQTEIFNSDLTKMWNINVMPGAYTLRDFHKIWSICTAFQDALAVRSTLDLLKGLWSYEGFKLRGSGFPQILSAP